MIGSLVVPVVMLVILVYGIFLYNQLVSLKHNVSKAWSNIDILLNNVTTNYLNWSKLASST